jgi:uncharacterized protein
MPLPSLVVSLPIEDRQRSFAFYREALGLDAVGELADDGLPEPLQFELADGVRLMLIPRGGFGWVVAGHEVAAPGHSECILSFDAASNAEVDRIVAAAEAAGARVLAAPQSQPWGYTGTFADPDGHAWMIAAAGTWS